MLKKIKLERTNFEVSEICFGGWGIGSFHYGDVSEKDGIGCIEAYLNYGGNFIDTARLYNNSENIIGDVLQKNGNRERVFVATKSPEVTPNKLREHLEESLRTLKSEYVDLLYMHDPPDDAEEMSNLLDIFEQFKKEGKIRAIGASIKGCDVTQRTTDLCRQYIRSNRVDVIQLIYSIFRQKTSEVFREAKENGVAILGRTVLENGFLTGKYSPGDIFRGNDHRQRWEANRLKNILAFAQELKSFAIEPPFQTLAEVSLRFALDTPGLTCVITGAKNRHQIIENLKVASLPSLPEELNYRFVSLFKDKSESFNRAPR